MFFGKFKRRIYWWESTSYTKAFAQRATVDREEKYNKYHIDIWAFFLSSLGHGATLLFCYKYILTIKILVVKKK